MTSLDLDMVNCKHFQIILLSCSLNSSKGLWRWTPLRNSPFGDTRISAAAAGWIDLVLPHSIYHCSYHWLSLSNDLGSIWGQTARRHSNNTICAQIWQLSYYDITYTLTNSAVTWKVSFSLSSDWSTDTLHKQAGTTSIPSYFIEVLKKRLLFTGHPRNSYF